VSNEPEPQQRIEPLRRLRVADVRLVLLPERRDEVLRSNCNGYAAHDCNQPAAERLLHENGGPMLSTISSG
jgi:hypothetical protein